MAETADSVVVASELVSKPQKIAAPRYRWIKQYSMAGNIPVNVPATNRVTVQYEIPTRSINYSRSFLCGRIVIPAAGAAGNWRWRYTDAVSFISSLNFRTRTGTTLIDMEYLQNYTQIVNKYETPLEQVLSADELDVVAPHRGFDDAKAEAKRPDNEVIKHPNVEFRYCEVSGDGADLTWNFRIPLSRVVPNSIFSRRSDLKLPEIAIMTVQYGPGTKIAWGAVSGTNPTSTASALAAACTLTTHLELACQEDPMYEAMIDERMRVGYSIPINFPMASQVPVAASTLQSVSVTYNSGYGKRLVKIYHAPFTAAEEKNAAYDHACDTTRKVTTYFVKLKGSRTSDENFSTDPADPTAYMHHKPLLDETAITNANVYHRNFAHVEDLARIGGPKQWRELGFRKDDAEIGIPLDQDFKFEFVANTQNAAYNHYTFAIVQRQLTLNGVTAIVE